MRVLSEVGLNNTTNIHSNTEIPEQFKPTLTYKKYSVNTESFINYAVKDYLAADGSPRIVSYVKRCQGFGLKEFGATSMFSFLLN